MHVHGPTHTNQPTRDVIYVQLQESVAEGEGEGLSAAVEPWRVLGGEQHELFMRPHHLLCLGDEQLPGNEHKRQHGECSTDSGQHAHKHAADDVGCSRAKARLNYLCSEHTLCVHARVRPHACTQML
jgi:hypothetical protein